MHALCNYGRALPGAALRRCADSRSAASRAQSHESAVAVPTDRLSGSSDSTRRGRTAQDAAPSARSQRISPRVHSASGRRRAGLRASLGPTRRACACRARVRRESASAALSHRTFLAATGSPCIRTFRTSSRGRTSPRSRRVADAPQPPASRSRPGEEPSNLLVLSRFLLIVLFFVWKTSEVSFV